MIALVPMHAAEFASYLECAVQDFAQQKVDSGQWSTAESLAQSRAGFDALLPLGLATAENFLFVIRDVAIEANVGVLWFAVQERAGRRIAYVYDVVVKPPYRRRGYGTRAFEALESEVASRGLCGIALHVFGHNHAARSLYAKLGYAVTNINLFKAVPGTRS